MIKIKTFFHKYWLFILLATIGTILAAFYFFNKTTLLKEKEILTGIIAPKITYYSSIKPNLNSLESNFPDFPEKIEIFQVNYSSFSDEQAIKISKDFGYQENPLVTNDIYGSIYTWSNDFNNLSVYLKEGKFHYGLDLLRNPELISGLPPSIQESKNKFSELLKEKGLEPLNKISVDFINEGYYFGDEANFIKTNQEDPKRTFAFLQALYKVNNSKIDGPETPLISLYFANNFQIARFDYSKIFEKIDLLDFYPLKAQPEVIETIQNNPQISFLKNSEGFYQENLIYDEKLPELKNLSFNKIELIYYKEVSQQTSLQPVFLITGTAVLNDGTQAEAGLYLPAIKDEYLLK